VDFDAPGRQEEVAGGVAAGFQAIGLPVALRPRPFAEYTQFLVTGRQEVFRLGWTGGWPSADAYLVPLFSSRSPDNVLGFRVAEVDEALAAAVALVDPTERATKLAEAERLIMERYPVIPIGQFRTAWVMSERVRGLSVAVTGTFDATSVFLSEE
jgi:ABC-type transport system substrate-binding protein